MTRMMCFTPDLAILYCVFGRFGLVDESYPVPHHELYRLGTEMLKVKSEWMRRVVVRQKGDVS